MTAKRDDPKGRFYFAYGSNLDTRQMRRRCPSARPILVGDAQDWRLTFAGAGFANIERAKGARTPGVVWVIENPADWLALDRYEGYPGQYRRIRVRVVLDRGAWTWATAYTMTPENARRLSLPSDGYWAICYAGYHAYGLDKTLLVRTWLQSYLRICAESAEAPDLEEARHELRVMIQLAGFRDRKPIRQAFEEVEHAERAASG